MNVITTGIISSSDSLLLYIACGVNGLDGCPRLPDILNGQVNYIPESVRDCYERDTFARNTCDEGFRVTGPSSRACSGSFVDNRLESVEWEPNDNVTCERKFMVHAWYN